MVVIEEKCLKFDLPNGKKVDVLTEVLSEIRKWLQYESDIPESGGFIIGYEEAGTGNLTLESVSPPYPKDISSRTRFGIRDMRHDLFLEKARQQESFYMGVWHTHSQSYPVPSSIDLQNWEETLEQDITGSEYIFFIIAGTKYIRIWTGDRMHKMITEIEESAKEGGLYKTIRHKKDS